MSKREAIEAAYRRDLAERRKVIRADEVPPFYDAITTEWLSAVLCSQVPGSKVAAFHFGENDDGTCNRRRIFLDYNQAGRDARLPHTVFCKAAHNLANRVLLSASATFSEITFYNRFRSHLATDAPVAYHAAYDEESWAAIVLLRDMAGEVEFCTERTMLSRASVESQLHLLAGLHGPFYDDRRFTTEFSDLIPFHRRLNNLGACPSNGHFLVVRDWAV